MLIKKKPLHTHIFPFFLKKKILYKYTYTHGRADEAQIDLLL